MRIPNKLLREPHGNMSFDHGMGTFQLLGTLQVKSLFTFHREVVEAGALRWPKLRVCLQMAM